MTVVTSSPADIDRWLHNPGYSLRSDQFTYSIPGVGSVWPVYGVGASEPNRSGFALPDAALVASFRAAIAAWDAVIAPDFVEVADNASSRGELRIAYTDMTGGQAGAAAYAYTGTPRAPGGLVGDIWVSTTLQGYDWSQSSTVLHEVGHTLGLKHPFVTPQAPTSLDDKLFTVMSYTQANSTILTIEEPPGANSISATRSTVFAITPMVLDIAAAQAIYGAETSTRTGDDIYTFAERAPTRQTIYDAGGIDTIDISNFKLPSVIDLRPGAYSSLGMMDAQAQIAYWTAIFPQNANFIASAFNGTADLYTYTDNLGIALGTIIENARGGSGDDMIIGNMVANVLEGGDGNNVFVGEEGDDLIIGGWDHDVAGYHARYTDVGTAAFRAVNGMKIVHTATEGSDVLYDIEEASFNDRTVLARDFTPFARSDTNGDGDSDLVYYYKSSGLIGSAQFANGTIVNSRTVGDTGSPAWGVEASGDFDRDGIADVVLKNAATGAFYIWSLNEASAVAGGRGLGAIGTNWSVVASGDFNYDGVADLLWRDASNGHVYSWMLDTGMNTIAGASFGVLGTNWTTDFAGDFDGDGDTDVLLRDGTNGHVYIYDIEDGAIQRGVSLGILGTDWEVAGIGDFDGDETDDIALKNAATGQFYLYLMDGDMKVHGSNLGIIGSGWDIEATGDYYADGTDDIVWRHADGRLYAWAMRDGGQAPTGSYSLGIVSSDLVIV